MRLTKNGVLRINFRDRPDNRGRLRCNFKCSYCIQRGARVREYPFRKAHFKRTKTIWDMLSGIEDNIMVRVNFNGETFIDEWAQKCAFYINRISNVKICEFITNNSVDPKAYLHELDPAKTTFNCSFHPEFMSIERFIENALILKNAGCDVFVNVCAAPQLIKKLPEFDAIFRKHDICLKLQGFITPGYNYMDKKYPEDYTAEERSMLKDSFYTKDEYEYFVDLKRTKGLDCYAGVDMVNIFIDGSVRRCFSGKIGNVKGLVCGKTMLRESPYPCHENLCRCYTHFIGLKEFREKYSLSERFVDNYDR